MLRLLKIWNDKYDIWSFTSDFIFVFGVLILDWSPVLLILLLIIDTSVMFFFMVVLFYKETKDVIRTVGFCITSPFFIGILVGLYSGLMDFIKNLKLENEINADPSQIFNSYILPIVLVSSALNHYAAYSNSIEKMKNGTYNSGFIKLFFLRYVFILAILLLLAFGYAYFNATIVLGLIIGKALLRIWFKKYRTII